MLKIYVSILNVSKRREDNLVSDNRGSHHKLYKTESEKYLKGCGKELFKSMPAMYFLVLPGIQKKNQKTKKTKNGCSQLKYPCKHGD